MTGWYDYRLVVLSIFISILAAYAARALLKSGLQAPKDEVP